MKKYFMLLIIIHGFILVGCNKEKPNLVCPDECLAATKYDDWIPVWCDEFDGDELNLDKWTVLNTSWGGGNQERQYYHPNNVFLEDGKLVIEARLESFGGKEYTSGRLDTKYKGDWLYGKIVVRAKMPSGRGTWPAIWMLPTDNKYGGWPRSGEIDIMEYVGYNKDRIHGTIHTEKFNHMKGTQLGKHLDYMFVEEEFYDYIMIWEPGRITLYVEDIELAHFQYNPQFNQDVPYHHAWPFDEKFHLILNLAIGGTWGGAQGVDNNIFPTRMYVDYVRVYQRDYAFKDNQKPDKIDEIRLASGLKNMIFWPVPYDNRAVEQYEIYVDNELFGTTRVNSFIFTKLEVSKSYNVKVRAVDFAGNRSDATEYTFTFR